MIPVRYIPLNLKWLFLAIFALAAAGLLSIIIVLLRLPFFYSPNFKHFFDVALVAHVNLTVNVWMLSVLFAFLTQKIFNNLRILYESAWILGVLATILITCSVINSNTDTFKSNYIPVINNITFFTGLALFYYVSLAISLTSFINAFRDKDIINGSLSTVLLCSLSAFAAAYLALPKNLEIDHFYEYLFWGGGHLMQFAFAQGLIIVYATLFNILHTNFIKIILILNAACTVPAPFIYCFFTSNNPFLLSFFTEHMRYFAGIAPSLVIVYCIITGTETTRYKYLAFLISAVMFLYGGGLGLFIHNSNVTIPAHYHGSVVAITIAFMAYIYLHLQKLDYFWSFVQLYIYGFGQLLHITGLAGMGGYGALRKTPGMAGNSIISQSLFIGGGITAIIGGFMFIYLATTGAIKLTRALRLKDKAGC